MNKVIDADGHEIVGVTDADAIYGGTLEVFPEETEATPKVADSMPMEIDLDVIEAVRTVVSVFAKLCAAADATIRNTTPRSRHLARHARKMRTRKKNTRRIARTADAILAAMDKEEA